MKSRAANDLPAELGLCLLCCRPASSTGASEEIERILDARIDWARLGEAALRHHVNPLVFRTLLERFPEAIPAAAFGPMKLGMERERKRALAMAEELDNLLAAFETAAVAVIPYKGPALARLLYDDVTLRSSGDLDFLCRECDLDGVLAVSGSHGYIHYSSLSPRQERSFRAFTGQYQMVRRDGRMTIEVHWRIAQSTLAVDLDYGGLWERAERRRIGERQALCFEPADLLIVLCVHGGKEQWCRLKWVVDVARWLDRYGGAWGGQALARAREQGCERFVLVGAGLANRLLGALLPEEIARRLREDGVATVLTAATAAAFAQGPTLTPSLWRVNGFRYASRERPRDRARYLLRTLLLPRPALFEMIALPDSLFALYYPIRCLHDYVLLPLWLLLKGMRAGRGSDERGRRR